MRARAQGGSRKKSAQNAHSTNSTNFSRRNAHKSRDLFHEKCAFLKTQKRTFASEAMGKTSSIRCGARVSGHVRNVRFSTAKNAQTPKFSLLLEIGNIPSGQNCPLLAFFGQHRTKPCFVQNHEPNQNTNRAISKEKQRLRRWRCGITPAFFLPHSTKHTDLCLIFDTKGGRMNACTQDMLQLRFRQNRRQSGAGAAVATTLYSPAASTMLLRSSVFWPYASPCAYPPPNHCPANPYRSQKQTSP